MTCNEDLGNAVGVGGDPDGFFVKTLRTKFLIPIVLFDGPKTIEYQPPSSQLYKLNSIVIAADSTNRLIDAVYTIMNTIFWNHSANFLIVDAATDPSKLQNRANKVFIVAQYLQLLDVQFVSLHSSTEVIIYNVNPFVRDAPKVWNIVLDLKTKMGTVHIFSRVYQQRGDTCRDMHFEKTTNVGGYPITFGISVDPAFLRDNSFPGLQEYYDKLSLTEKRLLDDSRRHYNWLIDNIVRPINASAVIVESSNENTEFNLHPLLLSDEPKSIAEEIQMIILPLSQMPSIAVTNYTDHKSQLTKILTVIDGSSRIGVAIVYVITFLFFKFFLDETTAPALLNLVRLTCGAGLTRLPRNVAPTIYLACLLMFVVTLQGVFTGNLATLLTSTISYPNVETVGDIARLGYKAYVPKDTLLSLVGNPVVEGHLVEIPLEESCEKYLLTEPLVACILPINRAVTFAMERPMHLSREAIVSDYIFYLVSAHYPLKNRLEKIMKTWNEIGIGPDSTFVEELRLQFVDDDEVKKNVERRIMNMYDLSFAFVILALGLTLSLVCFIGEAVVWNISLKIVKRRERVRTRLAWVN